MLKCKNIFITAVLALCIVALIPGVHSNHKQSGPNPILAGVVFHDGDLVFRKGKGLFSNYFSKAGAEAGSTCAYSHVGIIRMQNGMPFVIHTEANELTGVGHAKIEALDTFLDDRNASAGALYRLRAPRQGLLSEAVTVAGAFAKDKVPFDTEFDINNEKKLYCTKLVYLAYKKAGIELIRDFDSIQTPFEKNKKVITINNLLNSRKIILVKILKREG